MSVERARGVAKKTAPAIAEMVTRTATIDFACFVFMFVTLFMDAFYRRGDYCPLSAKNGDHNVNSDH
jgi:hypothetical protein